MSNGVIAVYGDWDGLAEPLRLGRLYTHPAGLQEVFEYEFEDAVLKRPDMAGLKLDRRLGWFAGRQYPPQGQESFGAFSDASPDRWGRLLMRRQGRPQGAALRIGLPVGRARCVSRRGVAFPT
jgi:serine/threonine-protein kinase HipA